MAYLFRLIGLLFLLGAPALALAAAPTMKWSYGGRVSPLYDSALAACGASGVANVTVKDEGVPNERLCLESGLYGAGRVTYGGYCSVEGQLVPAGGAVCPDAPPEAPDAAADFCATWGTNKVARETTGVSRGSAPAAACFLPGASAFEGANANKGCVMTIGDSTAVPNPDGTRSWSGTGVATGAVCTDAPLIGTGGDDGAGVPGTPAAPRVAENPCPSGFPGSVNGATVCVPSVPNAGIEGTKTTETKTPDGNSTSEHETTKCNGSICTTTKNTVVKNAAGETISSTPGNTVTQPINSLCVKDPGNKVCAAVGLGQPSGSGNGNAGSGSGGGGSGEGSSFGGTCAEGFKAKSEDAVVNAMAEETFRQNCKVNPDTDSQALGKAEAAKTGNLNKDNPNNGDFSIGPSNFDTTDAIGGGSGCIADKTVTIMGGSFVLPLSTVCPYLNALGLVLLACSFLLAARIVTRG